MDQWFRDILSQHGRVAICGGPRTGKTTLAGFVSDRPVFHTDDLINVNWSEVPARLKEMCTELRFVLEGVQVARALRRGLVVDAALWLAHPHVELSSGQRRMAKSVATVFEQWRASNPSIPVYERNQSAVASGPSAKVVLGGTVFTGKLAEDIQEAMKYFDPRDFR